MKAFWVKTDCIGGDGYHTLVWGDTRSKAKWISVQIYVEVGYGTVKQGMKEIRVYRAKEYDKHCPDPSKRQAWSVDNVRERMGQHD